MSRTIRRKGKIAPLRRGEPGTGKRDEDKLVWHSCECGEDVQAPANVGKVVCGRCVQRLVGSEVLPPPPLTPEQKAAKAAAFFAAQKAKREAEKNVE